RDLGAAGLSGASAEMCSTFGGRIVLDAVPLRETGMTPSEIMVSESQERMVLEVPPEHVQEVLAMASKYDLNSAVIGEVIDEPRYVVEFRGTVVADIPIKLLTEGAPLCTPERPKAQSHLEQPLAPDLTLKEKALRVLSSPNVATKEWVYQQYDHEVQTRTIVKPGNGAAVLSIDARRGIALSSGCNPTHVAKDQFQGAAGTVFENAMNLAVKGATPVAFVNCLNFGNPENANVFSQLERAVAGLSHAARILDIPIVGGNVSLYNESEEFHTAIIPTPSIGMVGILQDISMVPPAVFQEKGDIVMMIGETYPEYGGSEYAEIFEIGGAVPQPRETIKATIDALVKVVETGNITAASDISRGGIIAALGKMCKHVGAEVNLSSCLDDQNELFSESSGRAILTVTPGLLNSISAVLEAHGIPYAAIGTAGGGSLSITVGDSQLTLSLETIERSLNTLNEIMIA
ncbi:MAG: AIR synthase-related protein, partial [Halobacteriota archaeon]